MVISFSSKDYEGVNPNHNEALVVTLDIFDNEVRRMLINNGSSVNILFKHTVDRMKLGSVRSNECREDPLYGFGNNLVPIQGTLYLPVIFGSAPNQVTHVIKFYVINTPSSYNDIIGRSALTRIQAITSKSHLKIKFPTPTGVGEVKGDYEVAERCYSQALVMAETHQDNKRKAMVLRKQQSIKKHRPHSRDDARKEVQIIETLPDPKATKKSPKKQKNNQVTSEIELSPGFGQGNPTVQATNPETSEVGESNQKEMTAQDQIYMKKNTDARIQQLVSNMDHAKIEAVVETKTILINASDPSKKIKIGSRLEATFREELVSLLRGYSDIFPWNPRDMPGMDESIAMHSLDVNPERKPSSTGMVGNCCDGEKANGKWRMCIDYTDLNSACPKDPYPLPNIDQLIDATSGHVMLSFMDAYSGYNQIKMNPKDILKTAFITHRAVYAYVILPFGLTNTGTTYQRAMNKIFKD
ncbi:uncharacterized protein LOC141713754 [Apium graveolens]|uniref:uncharacterized protein LOC141713754 n=1 Tax=Apium graveolens TaxID=4045 RepID=UPI003D7BCEDF